MRRTLAVLLATAFFALSACVASKQNVGFATENSPTEGDEAGLPDAVTQTPPVNGFDGSLPRPDDGGDAGANCNTVVVFRPEESGSIADLKVLRPPPDRSVGGVIPDGRYLLLDGLLYTTEHDELEILEVIGNISIEIANGSARFVREFPDRTLPLERANGTFSITDTSFALTMTCGTANKFYGAVAGTTYSYDQTYDALILTVPVPSAADPQAKLVMTYIRS